MKFNLITTLAFGLAANAHCIFQVRHKSLDPV